MLALIVVLCLVTGGLASILCPTKFDPQQTVHLPHPTDCSKFLTCVGNHPFEQDCPTGLSWNAEQSYCDYPQLSLCSRGQLEPTPFNPTAVANSICLPQFNRCPVSSNPSEQVVFLKHRDCRKFYACVSTQQVELSCPPNLYWNSGSCQCDYEIDAECNGTDRVDVEVPEVADGEQNVPDDNADEEAAVGGADESEDAVVPEAEPENEEDQEPAQEPEGSEDVVVPEAQAENGEDQDAEVVDVVRVRRAADDDGSTTTASSVTSTTTAAATSSAASTTTSGSSATGTTGSSGGGSSGSTSGPGSGGSVESGADIRTVSSIVMIAFTAVMSVL